MTSDAYTVVKDISEKYICRILENIYSHFHYVH